MNTRYQPFIAPLAIGLLSFLLLVSMMAGDIITNWAAFDLGQKLSAVGFVGLIVAAFVLFGYLVWRKAGKHEHLR